MRSYCILHPECVESTRFVHGSGGVEIAPLSRRGHSVPGGVREFFEFDQVLGPGALQNQVFEEISVDPVRNALENCVSSLFLAYGPTSGGKTFVVTGGAKHFADRGLIPRSVSALFEALDSKSDKADFQVSVFFYELYKDFTVDLLADRRRKVSVVDGPRGAELVGLVQQVVSTENDAYHILFHGDSNRHFERLPLNNETSRGHCFYDLVVERLSTKQRAVLSFADLAPDVGVDNSVSESIAQGLSSLKAAVRCLSQCLRPSYEESLLTKLLQRWLDWPFGTEPESGLHFILPIKFLPELHDDLYQWLLFAQQAQAAFSKTRKIPDLAPEKPIGTTDAKGKRNSAPAAKLTKSQNQPALELPTPYDCFAAAADAAAGVPPDAVAGVADTTPVKLKSSGVDECLGYSPDSNLADCSTMSLPTSAIKSKPESTSVLQSDLRRPRFSHTQGDDQRPSSVQFKTEFPMNEDTLHPAEIMEFAEDRPSLVQCEIEFSPVDKSPLPPVRAVPPAESAQILLEEHMAALGSARTEGLPPQGPASESISWGGSSFIIGGGSVKSTAVTNESLPEVQFLTQIQNSSTAEAGNADDSCLHFSAVNETSLGSNAGSLGGSSGPCPATGQTSTLQSSFGATSSKSRLGATSSKSLLGSVHSVVGASAMNTTTISSHAASRTRSTSPCHAPVHRTAVVPVLGVRPGTVPVAPSPPSLSPTRSASGLQQWVPVHVTVQAKRQNAYAMPGPQVPVPVSQSSPKFPPELTRSGRSLSPQSFPAVPVGVVGPIRGSPPPQFITTTGFTGFGTATPRSMSPMTPRGSNTLPAYHMVAARGNGEVISPRPHGSPGPRGASEFGSSQLRSQQPRLHFAVAGRQQRPSVVPVGGLVTVSPCSRRQFSSSERRVQEVRAVPVAKSGCARPRSLSPMPQPGARQMVTATIPQVPLQAAFGPTRIGPSRNLTPQRSASPTPFPHQVPTALPQGPSLKTRWSFGGVGSGQRAPSGGGRRAPSMVYV